VNTPANRIANHVILSGGSRGLGQALAADLLGAGYAVSTFSRRPTEFTDTAAKRDDFLFQPADAADAASLTSFVQAAIGRFGIPAGLVNCAGLAVDGVLATAADEEIDRVLNVNLAGTLRLTRLVVREMLVAERPASIVNISSIIAQRGFSGLSIYAASKAGIDGMTRALARELGPRGITVNSVAPGYLETEMTHGLDEQQRQQVVRRTPLGRLGRVDDVTGAVRFLLSDAARFITGQTLTIDGGMTC